MRKFEEVIKYKKRNYVWGAHRGYKPHLYLPSKDGGTTCLQSLCGTAYSGDSGLYLKSKSQKCKHCLKLLEEEG